MKIKQIVGEHKKGFKANIYQRKKQITAQPSQVAPAKPGADNKVKEGASDANDVLANREAYAKKHGTGQVYKKTYPGDKVGMSKSYAYDIKRTGPKGQLPKEELEVGEDIGQQVYKVTKNDPNTGVTLAKPDGTQLILPPDKVNAIASNPNDPNKYLLNPDAVAQTQQGQPTGPEIGREVEVNDDSEIAATEAHDDAGDVGGDPTDDFINDIVDHDYEKAQGRLRELAGVAPAAGETQTPAPAELGNIPDSVTLDSADGFKDALKKVGEQSGVQPETLANIDKMVVADTDGTVDAEQTLVNMMTAAGEAMPQLIQMLKDLIAAWTTAMRSPEYATLDAAAKQSAEEALAEFKAKLPVMQRKAQEMQAQIQASKTELAQRKAAPRPEADVRESKEIEAMLRIAGLR